MDRFWRGYFSTASLLFCMYVGFGALGVLDTTLSKMHRPGGASADATSIASYSSLTSPKGALEVVEQWHAWFRIPGASGMSVDAILMLYFATDILVIAVPLFILLQRLAAWTDKRIDTFTDVVADDKLVLKSLVRMARVAVTVYLASDVVEDVILIGVGRWPSETLIAILGFASVVKWLALAAAVIGLVVGIIGTPRMRRETSRRRIEAEDNQQAAAAGDGAVPPEETPTPTTSRIWGQVMALRVHICVGAFLLALGVLPGDLGRQLDDAYLLLYGDRWLLLLGITLALAVVLALVLYQTGKLCVFAYKMPPRESSTSSRMNLLLVLGGAAMFVLGVVAAAQKWWFGSALTIPGVIALLVGFFSFFAKRRGSSLIEIDSEDIHRGLRLAVSLSVAPFVVLITMAARNGLRLLTIQEWTLGVVSVALALGAVPFAIVLMMWLTRDESIEAKAAQDGDHQASWRVITLIGAGSIALFIVMAVGAQPVGEFVGPWAIVFTFFIAVVLGLTALVLAGDRIPAYGVLATGGMRRAPLVALLVLCFIGTATLDSKNEYHSARLSTAAVKPEISVNTALTKWSEMARKPNERTKEVPLVFVASAGGGIRAAYWTTLVLACIIRQENIGYVPPDPEFDAAACNGAEMPRDAIFLASGISGGSLGLATIPAIDNRNDWWKPLRRDFLGPAVAAMTFRDVPNSVLRFNIHDEDRAAVLERAWERAVAQDGNGDLGVGFSDVASDNGVPVFPLLALNGTSVADGCRITVSALDLARPMNTDTDPDKSAAVDCLALDEARSKVDASLLPTLAGTKDAFDHTCAGGDDRSPKDIRLSTAALLSARFPYVSPTGTLYSCAGGDRSFDLDGGLIESSGASPLSMAWPEIVNWLNSKSDVCYSPKLVLIENGYLSQTKSRPPDRPAELTAPLEGISSVRNAWSPAERQAAALSFQKSFESVKCKGTPATAVDGTWTAPNVVDFYPVAQPGIEAPLGWTLSKFSQESLERQLATNRNQCAAEIVAAWFVSPPSEPEHCVKLRAEAEQKAAGP